MTEKTNIYSRTFSKIPLLQSKDTVNYNLCKTKENEFTFYGLEMVSINENSDEQVSTFPLISNSKESVLDILKYLYENSIKPNEMHGIVTDILNIKKMKSESVLAFA